MLKHPFARERDVANIGNHSANLGPDATVEIDFEQVRIFQLKRVCLSILLGRGLNKVSQRMARNMLVCFMVMRT